MAESTSPAAPTAPAIDSKALGEAVTAAMAEQEAARKARKAEKREKAEKAEKKAARIAAESAALGTGIPATAGATETDDQRLARLTALADQKFAEAATREGLAVTETDEQILERLLEQKLVPLRQARAEGGAVSRKGLAPLEAIADQRGSAKLLENASGEELAALAGAAFGPGRH